MSGAGTSGLKFGFIGAGTAASAHAQVLHTLGHRIAAVCARKDSSRVEAFAAQFGVEHTYDDWTKMVAHQSYDGLVVATSWDQTETVITGVAGLRVPCLVEKPVALTAAGIERVIEAAGGESTPIMVAYNRRFYEFFPRLRQQLECEFPISIDLSCPESIEPLIAAHGKEILPHLLAYKTSHWLDLLLHLLGQVEVVYMHRTLHRSGEYVVAYNGILRSVQYDSPIHLKIHFDSPSQTALTFSFPETIWRISPMEQLTVFKGIDCRQPTPTMPFRRYEPKVAEVAHVDSAFKPGFLGQMREFVENVVVKREPSKIGCGLGEALKLMELCEQISVKGESPCGSIRT